MSISQTSQITLCLVSHPGILVHSLMFTAQTYQGQGNNNAITFYPMFIYFRDSEFDLNLKLVKKCYILTMIMQKDIENTS